MPSTFPQGLSCLCSQFIILFKWWYLNHLSQTPLKSHTPLLILAVDTSLPQNPFPHGARLEGSDWIPFDGPQLVVIKSDSAVEQQLLHMDRAVVPSANLSHMSSLPASNSTERPGDESLTTGLITGRAQGTNLLYCVFTTLCRTNDAF